MASTYYSSADNNSDDGSISMYTIDSIWDGSYVHPNVNTRYARLKMHDCIRQAQSERNGAKLSAKIMGNCLHKVLKVILKQLNDLLSVLG